MKKRMDIIVITERIRRISLPNANNERQQKKSKLEGKTEKHHGYATKTVLIIRLEKHQSPRSCC